MDIERLKWIFVVLMILSALFWPFWLTAILFIAGVFLFERFYAGLIILFVMDALYGFETIKWGPLYGLLTVSGIIFYIILEFFKKRTFVSRNKF